MNIHSGMNAMQGMHTSPNSTTGGDWILGKHFESVYIGDEVSLGCRASGWDIQAAKHRGHEERRGEMGAIFEEILREILHEDLHSSPTYMVQ